MQARCQRHLCQGRQNYPGQLVAARQREEAVVVEEAARWLREAIWWCRCARRR